MFADIVKFAQAGLGTGDIRSHYINRNDVRYIKSTNQIRTDGGVSYSIQIVFKTGHDMSFGFTLLEEFDKAISILVTGKE